VNCNSTSLNSFFINTIGGSGGKSSCINGDGINLGTCTQGYPKPAWQTGTGVPPDSRRDVPDVSLFAADGLNGSFYVICERDQTNGIPCSVSNFLGVGGTSASAPSFAGIMALVDQKSGPQGNANYVLYKLAGQGSNSCTSRASAASTCVFYDIPAMPPDSFVSPRGATTNWTTATTIATPCATGSLNCTTSTTGHQYGVLSGYSAASGYDLATGLGSVNALNLINNWTAFALTPSSTSLTLTFNGSNQINITHGQSVDVAINVTPPSGTVPPTGNVSLIADTAPPSAPAQVTQQGVQGFTLTSSTCSGSPCGTVTGTTNALPGGTYDVVAQYAGDGTFGSSTSSPSSVTVAPEASKTSLGIVTFDLSTGQITSTNAATFPYGSPYLLRADVTNSSGSTCFNSTSATVSYACPTGAINLTDNSASLGGGTFALNSEGYAEYQAIQLNGGSHNLTASYGGDASYNASSGSDAVTVTPAPTTTVILSPVSTTPPQNEIIGQPFTVFVQTQSSSSGVAPAGTYTLFDGTSQLAGTVSANGFTIPSSDQVFLNGSIQTSISGPSGSHNLTVHYSGDTNYASSVSSSVTLNALYPTTTALTVNPNNVILGNSVTLTATVSTGNPASNASLKPTGSISFNSNYGPVTGSVTTTVSQDSSGNWIVQASVTTTPQQSEVVSANFSGDSNYAASYQELGVNVTIPDFSISANSGSLTITAGQTGTTTLTITPATNYTSTVTLSCPSAPFWGGTCTISPSSVTLSNGASATATLSLSSLAPSSNLTALAFPSRMRRVPMLPPDRGAWWALSGAAGLASLLLFVLPGKRRSPRAAFGLALVGLLSFAVGCGGGASGSGGGGGGGGGPVPSSTTISASTTKIAQNSGLTLNSTVTSSGSFTGGVTFNSSCQYSQYAALTNGTAQIQVPPGSLGVGTCAFTAQYSGDFSHFPSQSGGLNIAVTGNASETVFAQTSTDVHSLQVNVTLQ
jgi:hypothetical protein